MAYTPRSVINQVFQIGAEDTPGGGGQATNRLGTLGVQIAPVASGAFGMFRPSGGKYVGQVVPTDIYAEGPFTDTIDFNTIPFLLWGNVGIKEGFTPTLLAAGAWHYEFETRPFAPLGTITYAVQEGEDGAVYPYNNVCIPDLNMRFMRTGASQAGGRFLGRCVDPNDGDLDTATLRQGRSINGIKTGVWTAANWTTLTTPGGGARLDPPAIDISVRHNGIFAPWYALDDSIQSFAGVLEGAADAGFQITVLADVSTTIDDIAGMFNNTKMEDGTPILIKVVNIGPLITGAFPYQVSVFMAGVISGPPRRANSGNLRVWQWDAVFVPQVGVTNPTLRVDVDCALNPTAFDYVAP